VIGSTGSHRSMQCSLGTDELPDVSAPIVVIDPPWYPEYFEVFLWAAARLVTKRGHVLVSFPAAGTRPMVKDERDRSLERAEVLGLELQEIRRNAVGYRSPPFERAALEAAGLGSLPGDWRRGDLLLLRRCGAGHVDEVSADLGERDWSAVPAEPTQVRVRQRASDGVAVVDPRLVTIVAGDVLSSVSRRDPRRTEADVWTANHRVFHCVHPSALTAIATATAAGDEEGGTAVNAAEAIVQAIGRDLTEAERMNVEEAHGQWLNLLALETEDLRRHLWLDET
jgi:hypothetical protein